MFTLTTRRKPARRFALNVDTLEGRQLLSGIISQHIGTPVESKTAPADVKKTAPAILFPVFAQVEGIHIGTGLNFVSDNETHVRTPVSAGTATTTVATVNQKGGTNLLTAPIKQDLNPQPLPPGYAHEPEMW